MAYHALRARNVIPEHAISRRRHPLGVAMAGRLKARLIDRGALAARLVAS